MTRKDIEGAILSTLVVKNRGSLKYAVDNIIKLVEKEKRDVLIHFLDSIRDYEHESHNLIGHDERETYEFVDIYLNGLNK